MMAFGFALAGNAQSAAGAKTLEKIKGNDDKKIVIQKTEKKAEFKRNGKTVVLKKDGTPDRRYKANKVLKKDGTPDKRYKMNKDLGVKRTNSKEAKKTLKKIEGK